MARQGASPLHLVTGGKEQNRRSWAKSTACQKHGDLPFLRHYE
jgi:hypothetical protein